MDRRTGCRDNWYRKKGGHIRESIHLRGKGKGEGKGPTQHCGDDATITTDALCLPALGIAVPIVATFSFSSPS